MTERQPPAHTIQRDQKVLRAIRDSVRDRGFPPTMDEIGEQVGLPHKAQVVRALERLERDGHIQRTPGRAGGIRISGANTKSRTETM